MSYEDIYKLRLNRYGLNYQERVQREREKNFDLYLLKSTNRIDFQYGGQEYAGSFERYKQDETETLHYLLTKTTTILPPGTVLTLPNSFGEASQWLVYYLEKIQASGYNKYIMLHLTHFLQWSNADNETVSSWAYLYGQENSTLKDVLNVHGAVYREDSNPCFLIMPKNKDILKDVYFIVGENPYQQYFRVTGFDIQSTKGIEYVTIDPVYKYDLTPAPIKEEGDKDSDFFWLEGGK